MVVKSALTTLVHWKALKRLLILGLYPHRKNGCRNHYNNPRDPHRQDKAQQREVQRLLAYAQTDGIIHRFQLVSKTRADDKTWNFALQEMRSLIGWHENVFRRLMEYEHRSHVAYMHALETLLMVRMKQKGTKKAQKLPENVERHPGETTLYDITVCIFVIRRTVDLDDGEELVSTSFIHWSFNVPF